MTMTGLNTGSVNKVLQAKQNKVMEMSKTILPPTVGGKDVRSAKQKLADQHTIRFDVAQKQLFERSLEKHNEEMQLIRSITQEQRATNMTKLMENKTFM